MTRPGAGLPARTASGNARRPAPPRSLLKLARQREQVGNQIFDLLRRQYGAAGMGGGHALKALHDVIRRHDRPFVDNLRIDKAQAQLARGEAGARAVQRGADGTVELFLRDGHLVAREAVSVAAGGDGAAARGVARFGGQRRRDLAALGAPRNRLLGAAGGRRGERGRRRPLRKRSQHGRIWRRAAGVCKRRAAG